MFNLDLDENIVIIGDMNMNLLNNTSNMNMNLINFLIDNNLSQRVTEATRICTKYYEKTNQLICSETLIDVVIENNNTVKEVANIMCPFSDHMFVMITLDTKSKNEEKKYFTGRNLSSRKVDEIVAKIMQSDFKCMDQLDTNSRWNSLRATILNIIDEISPEKKIQLKNENNFPWFDGELHDAKIMRDREHRKYLGFRSVDNFITYEDLKKNYNQLNKIKMINYFKDKAPNDFKNSKKFWQFYSATIKLKSSKDNQASSTSMNNGDEFANDPGSISNLFNIFFTSLSSNSTANHIECSGFIDKCFTDYVKHEIKDEFEFKEVSEEIVLNLIMNLSTSSGPGISGISSKILKAASNTLVPLITSLFNQCLAENTIPIEWKTAVVTPIYKNKGDIDDVNNYRGISVLPPLAKVFEKVLATQMIVYLNKENILFDGQHGFRSDHSCETALHILISEMNRIKSKRLIGLFLFMDLRKAFDLVDPSLLLIKLKKYGFSEKSILLIANYFSERSQLVKYDNNISSQRQIRLSVPQGSVLGPLLFLLFINDLPFFITHLKALLFADDTTLYRSENDLTVLLELFRESIKEMIKWCTFNRLDINWSKTYVMFVTNKKNVELPNEINVDDNKIMVVNSFKLLGVIIDNKLNFSTYCSHIRKTVNSKLHSIKRLFYLPSAVKLQFFKSFILPYFDYCATLFGYFPKEAIQKLANCYNICLNKLLGLKSIVQTSKDYNKLNNLLEKYGLANFQHRVIARTTAFSFKLLNDPNAPAALAKNLINNDQLEKRYFLKNIGQLQIPRISDLNNYGMNTFEFYFSKFINSFCIKDIKLEFNFFKKRINNNINLIFDKFVELFPKFDLSYYCFYYK